MVKLETSLRLHSR